MMKKTTPLSRILKAAVLFAGCVLVLVLPLGGLSAAAEGYWSTRMNEEGELVQIYTYTDMEPITYLPVSPEEAGETAQETQQAAVEVALAALPATAQTAEAIPAKASNPLGGLIAAGLLSLAGLAVAFYKGV